MFWKYRLFLEFLLYTPHFGPEPVSAGPLSLCSWPDLMSHPQDQQHFSSHSFIGPRDGPADHRHSSYTLYRLSTVISFFQVFLLLLTTNAQVNKRHYGGNKFAFTVVLRVR